MARASFLFRRDGRYWFQIRFDPFRVGVDPIRHVRFALRTAEYPVAVRRMVRVMSIITEFKVCPDYRATAVDLFGRLLVAMAVRGPYSEDHLVEWTGLERVCDRFVAAARAINHPIGIHSPEFWPTWRRFVERNEKIDSALRRAGPRAAPSGAQIDESDEIVSAPEMPADVKAKLGIADLPAAAPGAFRDLIFRPDLDNGTTITSIRTQWGEDEALIGRSDDAPPTVESAPVPARNLLPRPPRFAAGSS